MDGDTILDPDYLVIGSGAMGMAFTDVLLTETDATVALVDRHQRPGGHWNDAYPFVRLHQPSSFYGVNSRALGGDAIDQTGWNAGLSELASGAEVVAYFDQVLHQQFLPSGRARYFPMCESDGGIGWAIGPRWSTPPTCT
jgi:cation diffusion facilitator CzcD-associated flavoprotein CzcO